MAEEYMTAYHFTKCDKGSREEYINLPVDHGVISMTTGYPLLNANDHKYEGENKNIRGYCSCKVIGQCRPLTPKVWESTAKQHLIEGAPALTENSKLKCMYGGTISFCDPPADVQKKMQEQEKDSDKDSNESNRAMNPLEDGKDGKTKKKGFLSDKRIGASKEYDKIAQKLGFERTGERSHGQPIYRKGRCFISPDANRHNGGFWKMAKSIKDIKSRTSRKGTYDKNLNRIGD